MPFDEASEQADALSYLLVRPSLPPFVVHHIIISVCVSDIKNIDCLMRCLPPTEEKKNTI